MKISPSIALSAALCLSTPAFGRAQATPAQPGPAQAPSRVVFDPSGRGLTEIGVRGGGMPAGRISIDYGQPHASGRVVFGTLVPFDSVWRAGANRATQLTTDVAITIGGIRLAPGSYTLALWVSKTEPKLVINSRSRQWGIPYNTAGEIARVPMRVRTLTEPVESFTIALVPNAQRPGMTAPPNPGTGVLTMTWGTMQFSVDFAAQQP